MGLDHAVKLFSGGFVDKLIKRIIQFQIKNIAAVPADHMIVGVCAPVKAVAAVRRGNLDDLPDICQQIEVAVNGAKADIGKFFLHMHVYHVGSGMRMGGGQILSNGLPLPAVF